LLWLYLQQRTNLFSTPLKVLHFAPEFALQRRFRQCSNLDYISADLSEPEAMQKMDITAIPSANQTFDVILCSHVLEHIPDDRQAMRELHRVLKPGGWAILLVPIDMRREQTFEDPTVTDPQERLRLFEQTDHVRIYGRDYVQRLEQAGFMVRQEDFLACLDPTLVQRGRLSAPTLDNTIFHCIA
jgi:SAM-dependent methyltransferase